MGARTVENLLPGQPELEVKAQMGQIVALHQPPIALPSGDVGENPLVRHLHAAGREGPHRPGQPARPDVSQHARKALRPQQHRVPRNAAADGDAHIPLRLQQRANRPRGKKRHVHMGHQGRAALAPEIGEACLHVVQHLALRPPAEEYQAHVGRLLPHLLAADRHDPLHAGALEDADNPPHSGDRPHLLRRSEGPAGVRSAICDNQRRRHRPSSLCRPPS